MVLPSKNVASRDNQQERLITIGWIVGFIDGEGCFSVSLHRNPTTRLGWQIMPEFVATQGEKSLKSLQKLENFFECGNIFINRRYDNHRRNLYRYCVRKRSDLIDIIIPFFQKHKLQTSKHKDFELFAKVVLLMEDGVHLTNDGIEKIIRIATKMNTGKRKRFIKK